MLSHMLKGNKTKQVGFLAHPLFRHPSQVTNSVELLVAGTVSGCPEGYTVMGVAPAFTGFPFFSLFQMRPVCSSQPIQLCWIKLNPNASPCQVFFHFFFRFFYGLFFQLSFGGLLAC
jgi:hypothetical protein